MDTRFRKGEHRSLATEFKPGERLSPQTEIKPGQRLSPKTEFRKGEVPHNNLPIGSITIRTESATGSPRAWVKIANPREWKPRAIFNWEQVHGKIPKGMIVHHKDRNTINDYIENLELQSRSDHAKEHQREREKARAAKFRAKKEES